VKPFLRFILFKQPWPSSSEVRVPWPKSATVCSVMMMPYGTVEHGHIVWLPADSVPILQNSPGRRPLWEWNGSWNAVLFVSFVVLEKESSLYDFCHKSLQLFFDFFFLLVWLEIYQGWPIFMLEGRMIPFRSEKLKRIPVWSLSVSGVHNCVVCYSIAHDLI
jgi:hypothetical protein